MCFDQRGVLPVGQTDPFDGVVAVIHFVTCFKHDTEPPATEALHRLKVRQVPVRTHTVSNAEESNGPQSVLVYVITDTSDNFYRGGIKQLPVVTTRAYKGKKMIKRKK